MARPSKGVNIKYVPIGELERAPRNPRLHADDDLGLSIERFGFINPLIRDDTSGKLVAGHGRLDALLRRRAGGHDPPKNVQLRKGDNEWLVPVLTGVAFESDQEAEAFLLADNRLSEIGGWDQEGLETILRDLHKAGMSMEGLGWTQAQIDALVAEAAKAGEGGGGGESRGPASTKTTDVEEMKQVVLYMTPKEYELALEGLTEVQQENHLPDFTAAFFHIFGLWKRQSKGDAFRPEDVGGETRGAQT